MGLCATWPTGVMRPDRPAHFFSRAAVKSPVDRADDAFCKDGADWRNRFRDHPKGDVRGPPGPNNAGWLTFPR